MIFGKLFGRTPQAPPEPIVTELILTREAAGSSDPYEVVQDNINFCNFVLYTAFFQPAEIIPDPIWSYHVDHYLAQAMNGGHGEYVGNTRITTGEKGLTIEATQRGLAAHEALLFDPFSPDWGVTTPLYHFSGDNNLLAAVTLRRQ